MPTVIDSLVVEFGLDPKNFTTGQKTIVEALRNLESQASRSSVGVGRSGVNIVSMFRGIQQPIATLRRQMEVLALSTIAPQRGLNNLAQQGQRTGTAVSAAATAGAISLRTLGIAGVAAFGVFETLKKTIEGASDSATRTFGSSVGAAAAGANIQRFTAFAQAMRITGHVPDAQVEQWASNFALRQAQARMGVGTEAFLGAPGAALAQTRIGANLLYDSYETLSKKFAAAAKTMDAQTAIVIGSWLGYSAEMSLALQRNGDQLEANIRTQEKLTSVSKEDERAALQLLRAADDFKTMLGSLTRAFYTAVSPALAHVLDVATKFLRLVKGDEESKSAKHLTDIGPLSVVEPTTHGWAKIGAGAAAGAATGATIGAGIGLLGGPIGAAGGATIGSIIGAVGGAWNWNAGAKPAKSPASPSVPGPQSSAEYPSDLDQRILAREGSRDNSVSPAGAIGRNQIMPSTAAGYGVSRAELFDPNKNMELGNRIRRDLWNKYHDADAVMVAYNAGPSVADRWLASGKDPRVLPAETRRYIQASAGVFTSSGGSGNNKGWPFRVQSGAPGIPANITGWAPESGPGWAGKKIALDRHGNPIDFSKMADVPVPTYITDYIRAQNTAAAAGNTVTTNHGDVSVGDVHIHTASNDPATHGQLFNDSIRNLAYPSNSGAF